MLPNTNILAFGSTICKNDCHEGQNLLAPKNRESLDAHGALVIWSTSCREDVPLSYPSEH